MIRPFYDVHFHSLLASYFHYAVQGGVGHGFQESIQELTRVTSTRSPTTPIADDRFCRRARS